MSEKKKFEAEESKPQFAIFDWIVSLPVIRILKPLYEWKRSFWIYCFLGFISVVCNYLFTIIITDSFKLYGSVANIIAWLLSTFISFILFRYLFFDRTNNSFINELLKFASARLFTLAVETLTIFIFVDNLNFDLKIIKAILIPVTALLNYLISKLFVFKDKK